LKKIRVKVTKVFEYTPDLNEDFYLSEGIKSIEAAMEVDMRDCRDNKMDLEDLDEQPYTSYHWEVIDE
jgi:hypothetical protein